MTTQHPSRPAFLPSSVSSCRPALSPWARFRMTRLVSARTSRFAAERERGDVPGWVLITIMTAGLVIAIWALAGPQLEAVFNESISRILDATP